MPEGRFGIRTGDLDHSRQIIHMQGYHALSGVKRAGRAALTTTNPSDVRRWEQFPFHLYRDCKQCHLWPVIVDFTITLVDIQI